MIRIKAQDKRHLVGLLGCSSMSTAYNRDTWVRLSAAGLVNREETSVFSMFGAKGVSVSLTPTGDATARELLRTDPKLHDCVSPRLLAKLLEKA